MLFSPVRAAGALLLLAGCYSDAARLKVTQSDPADTSTGIPLNTTLALQLNQALDPEQLAGVVLAPTGLQSQPGRPVQIDLTYDGERTLSVDPALPLRSGTRYTLRIPETFAASGTALTEAVITFSTLLNPELRSVNYDGAGSPSSYRSSEVDTQGRTTLRLDITDPGLDGIFLTTDDLPTQGIRYTYGPAGRVLEEKLSAAGLDDLWGTADDARAAIVTSTYDPSGFRIAVTRYEDPGADGLFQTSDDIPSEHTSFQQANTGRALTRTYTDPGADGLWFTGDDFLAEWTDTRVTDAAETVALLNGAGSDGLPFTDDDLGLVLSRGYDLWGNLLLQDLFSDSGSDGLWYTADDHRSSSTRWVRGTQGQALSTHVYSGPGADTVWGTPDDQQILMSVPEYRLLDLTEITQRDYTAGADQVFGTVDDIQTGLTTTERHDHGTRVGRTRFTHPGTDAQWNTADDVPATSWEYAPDL